MRHVQEKQSELRRRRDTLNYATICVDCKCGELNSFVSCLETGSRLELDSFNLLLKQPQEHESDLKCLFHTKRTL